MECLHCHVHKSCLPDLHQICSVTTVFWTGSRRDVSELCNHQERSSLPTDFTGLYLQCQLGSLFGLECYDWLWLACCAVEVESFARKAPITETNLDRLERRIQSRAQGKAWESRSESRKVEKSFDKSVCCLFPLLYSTSLPKNFSKTICSDSWWCIYREQSHQRHFETWQAWFKWHSHANLQSQKSWCQWCQPKWVLAFSCVFSFSQLFAILAFFNVCQQTKTWCFATFSWTSTSEIGRIFTDFLVFFFEFSFRCAQIVTGWFGSSKILVEAVHWLESKEQEFPGKRERATQSVKKRLTQYHKYTCCSPLGCFQHVCEATVKCEQVNVWAPKVQHLWLENNS